MLLPSVKVPTNSWYCWIPRIRFSQSVLNLATLSLSRRRVQPLAIQRTPVTPIIMRPIVIMRFILLFLLSVLMTLQHRRSRSDAGTGADDQIGREAPGFRASALEHMEHQFHGGGTQAVFWLT